MDVAKLIVRVGADINEMKAGLEDGRKELRKFASTGASEQAKALGAALSTIGEGAKRAGRNLTLGVTAPLLGVGVAAIKVAADYEQTMDVFQATSVASAAQMEQVGKLAQQLGADLTLPGTSANDATLAMLEMNKAGMSLKDTMAGAKGVLQLSAAAQIENKLAAEITANALKAFELQGNEAVRVADLLAASAKSSSGEITDVSAALQMSATVFAQSKMPIEDLVTAIGLMANAGIKGSDAGTSLKTMMLALQAPTDKAAETMKRIGVSVYDAQGKMKPMRDIVGQFSGALGGMTQEQQSMALKTIFGTDAIRAANIVLQKGTAAWDKQKKATTEAGVAAQLSAAQNKGLKGALDALKSALETAALSAEPYLRGLADMVRGAAEWVNKLNDISPGMKNLVVGLGLAAVAIGPLLIAFGSLAGAIGAVLPVAGGIAAVLVGPVGLAIVGVGAAIALLVVAWKKDWFGIRETVRAAWGAINVYLHAGLDIFTRIFGNSWFNLVNVLKGVWDMIVGVVKIAWGLVSGFITAGLQLFSGDWEGAWETVKRSAKVIWDGIIQLWKGFGDALINLVAGLLKPLRDAALLVWEGFVSAFTGNVSRGEQSAEKAGGRIALAAVKGAKKALEAHSPSRVMRRLGQDTVRGYTDGMSAGLDGASKAGHGLGQAAVDGARKAVRRGKSEIEKEMKIFAQEMGKAKARLAEVMLGSEDDDARVMARIRHLSEAMKQELRIRLDRINRMRAERGAQKNLREEMEKTLVTLRLLLVGWSPEEVSKSQQYPGATRKQINLLMLREQVIELIKSLWDYKDVLKQLPSPQEAIAAGLRKIQSGFEGVTAAAAAAAQTLSGAMTVVKEAGEKGDVNAQWDKGTVDILAPEDYWEKNRVLFQIQDEIAARTRRVYESLAYDLSNVFRGAFEDILSGSKDFFQSLRDGFNKMLQQMAVDLLTSRIYEWFTGKMEEWGAGNGTLAGVFGEISPVIVDVWGSMAIGGPVTGGRSYLVGEEGPEVFVPHTSGRVVPNGAMAGITQNNTIIIQTQDVNSFSQSRNQVAQDVFVMMQRAQRRAGG